MSDESMTFAHALRLGAEALRADAESSAPGEIAADAGAHAEDLAAAAILELHASVEDSETLAARHALERLYSDGTPAPEDRVSAGRGDRSEIADVIDECLTGERFVIAGAACSILADLIRSGSVTLSPDQTRMIERATRRDWIEPGEPSATFPLSPDPELADKIESAIDDAGGGEEGWATLEYHGSDRYLGLSAVVEVARIVQRMLRDGSAPPDVRRDAREALLIEMED